MRFSDIPFHQSVKDRLVALVDNGSLPHALLLEGHEGIGKHMLVRALAQYIHCTDKRNGDSCGICHSCRLHQSLSHPDVIHSFPVIKITGRTTPPTSDDYLSQWNEFITEYPFMDFSKWLAKLGNENAKPVMYVTESDMLSRKLSRTSNLANSKIVVVWLPERINEECSNKLLKLIEEPPTDTLFLLSSDKPSEILPTVYSRLQRIEVKPVPENELSQYLISNNLISGQDAQSLAHLALGSVNRALNLASNTSENEEMLENFTRLMRLAYQKKIIDLRAWSDKIAKSGREGAAAFLSYCERLMGENFLYNLADGRLVYLSPQEAEFSSKFARFINERNVEKLRKVFIDARTDILGNGNAKIVLFDVAVKTILLLKA